jgi:hypothetical protein
VKTTGKFDRIAKSADALPKSVAGAAGAPSKKRRKQNPKSAAVRKSRSTVKNAPKKSAPKVSAKISAKNAIDKSVAEAAAKVRVKRRLAQNLSTLAEIETDAETDVEANVELAMEGGSTSSNAKTAEAETSLKQVAKDHFGDHRERVADENTDWVELFPAGVSVATAMGRPVLILKDPLSGDVLPVWMQPLDAGVAMAELSHTMGATPHAVTRQLLAAMKFKVRSCTFVELIGHHQYALIELTTFGENSDLKIEKNSDQAAPLHLRVRADEAMSFCLQASAKFFSTKDFMSRCRDLDVDLAKLESSLVEGTLPALQAEIEISSKKHPYVM